MKKESKDRDSFFRHYYNSSRYSIQGLIETFKTERSFHLWIVSFIITLVIAIVLKFSIRDYCLVFILFTMILIVELLNTAIEHTVDLITKEIHPLAKKAKDCGSAASFVITLMAIVFGIFIIIPYIS